MTRQEICRLGKQLVAFLARFKSRFRTAAGFVLLAVYIRGLLSDLQRKNVEAIALEFGKPPRTLQRFLESVKWDEQGIRDDLQKIIAKKHSHRLAVGCLDESGVVKSGTHTVGVGRQWLGSRGKIDNGVVGVHLSYSTPTFQCLLDSQLYLPEDWANDTARRKKTTSPTRWSFAPSNRLAWN